MENNRDPALIFIGGEHPDSERVAFLRGRASPLIAADSGYDSAMALGFQPEVIIGDMDSVRALQDASQVKNGIPRILRWPQAKDSTDTELALEWAWKEGHQRCFLIGGGGGRLDHLLGIHAIFQRERAPDRWYTGCDEVILIRAPVRLSTGKGVQLSFFPVGSELCQLSSTGLRWPLDELSWKTGDCGISNESVSEIVELIPKSGRALMVRKLHRYQTPIDPAI